MFCYRCCTNENINTKANKTKIKIKNKIFTIQKIHTLDKWTEFWFYEKDDENKIGIVGDFGEQYEMNELEIVAIN